MGKKKDTRAEIAACVDPRFMGCFKKVSDNNEKESENKGFPKIGKGQVVDENQGFRDFLSKKLFEYLESQIKEIEPSDDDSQLFKFQIDNVSLFQGSDILNEQSISTSSNDPLPPKKKRKKDKNSEKERIKEIAVTTDWIHQQAKLFNS